MADLVKVKRALEHAMRVTVGEPVRREIEAALAELEPFRSQEGLTDQAARPFTPSPV